MRWSSLWLRESGRRRREIAFAVVGLPLAAIGGLYVGATLYMGGLLAITLVGLPVVAAAVQGGRALGWAHRWLAERLLDEPIAAPPPLRSHGFFGWVRAGLTDVAGWRILLYLLIRVPVAVVTFVAAVATWVYGIALFGAALFQLAWPIDDVSWLVLVEALAVGAVLLAIAPSATRMTADLNRWLARTFLAPGPAPVRMQMLERARSEVAADATATLHQIERDLHDGTQARLVAVGMSLAMADEALDAEERDRAKSLVRRARDQIAEATSELRQLTRGINPVALDRGLEEALPTLAADAGIPTDLHVTMAERPSPAIERVVYFCVAELLTNAAKHSGADSVRVDVTAEEGRLRIRVTDDGQGGASLGAGSGLLGVRDRLQAVDGQLQLSSPDGGPTVITAQVPVRL